MRARARLSSALIKTIISDEEKPNARDKNYSISCSIIDLIVSSDFLQPTEHCILQNNILDIYQHYFDDMIPAALTLPRAIRYVFSRYWNRNTIIVQFQENHN